MANQRTAAEEAKAKADADAAKAAEEAKAQADQNQNATTTRAAGAGPASDALMADIAARLRGAAPQPDPNAGREWTATTDKQTGVITARLK